MGISFSHVDVFSQRPYGGNSLAVFADGPFFSAQQMLEITQELRHFETVFFEATDQPGTFRARIFSLSEELPFAGHPLIGGAAVLHHRAGVSGRQDWRFALRDKTVTVTTSRTPQGYYGRVHQGTPTLSPPLARQDAILTAFTLTRGDHHPDLPMQVVSTGLRYLIVPVVPGALRRARIREDITPRLRDLGAQFAVLLDEQALEVRHWNNDGIVEDIATGSAAGAIGAYRLTHGLAAAGETFVLHQGQYTGRASTLHVQPEGSRQRVNAVKVGGDVALVGTGVPGSAAVNSSPVIGADELRTLIGFEDLIEPVSAAFQQTSARLAENGLQVLRPGATPASGDVYVKSGTLRGHRVFIVKISPWFAVNVTRKQPQGGFIGVFDSETGHTLALLDEQHYLSDIRTAAAGSLAARLFAPQKVRVATVLGSGVQAYWQPQALFRERRFEALLIWARDRDKAEKLVQRLRPVLPTVDIRVENDLEAAVRRSEVLITATLAREPLVRGEWLSPGQHITAVGADDPTKCELDALALQRARVFVDSLDAAGGNGDVGRAIQSGDYVISEVAGELGEVLIGTKAGRCAATDITIAKFVGLGAQDLVAAEVCLERLGIGPARTAKGHRKTCLEAAV